MGQFEDSSYFFQILWTHTGIIFALFVVAIAVIWWRRGQIIRDEFPDRETGYKKILKWFIVFTAGPFLFMEFAVLTGIWVNLLTFMDVKNYGYVEWAFFGVIFAEGLLLNYWVFFRNGASYLAKHPGYFTTLDEKRNKWYFRFYAVLTPVSHIGFLFASQVVMGKY